MTEVDHLVIACDTLVQGVAWCEQELGVTPGPGGRHPLMSTHNRLLRLGGEFPAAYFELIAIDPDAPPPGRTRWFGLDRPALQAAVREAPRLVQLVARTREVEMLRWGLINRGVDPGRPLAAERETPAGLLRWRIAVRDDGLNACDGLLPTLIEWQGVHPTDAMPVSALTLASVSLGGLPAPIAELLRLRQVDSAETPGLSVQLDTPRGRIPLEQWRDG
ncbi:VOC family protein [Aquincola sp. S2]|uniref:VOC family protein n=1 Tax=Pseudaquabacterium terrae TaxID=2732868 RepID=A0ABX2EM43_9BURK|nr:VOC family protein [Aquabacterium terrae]NRF69659.1 VOC family protein [Aquabacterium terrae]